jgi:hypothetical protein
MSEGRVEETRARSDSHPVDEVLPAGRMAAFGLQHVMTTYAGIIAVPLIVATALELPLDQLVYIINHTKETILEDAESRLKHSREWEILIPIVEIVEIANYRLQDLIEEPLIGAGH